MKSYMESGIRMICRVMICRLACWAMAGSLLATAAGAQSKPSPVQTSPVQVLPVQSPPVQSPPIQALSVQPSAVAATVGGKPGSAFPSCSENLASVPVPSAPHGLFTIIFPNKELEARAKRVLLHNPVVCGANFYLVWSEIDRGPGASPRYDFSHVEQQMGPWIQAGKQVNLIGWAVAYGGKRVATPDYVLRDVQSVSCEHAGGPVPVFWEKGFMDNYQQFMKAAVEHFGSNRAVGYIRFGLGLGGETYPACMYTLKEKGFTPQVWRKYIFDMLDYEASLNSPKTLMVGINSFGQPPDLEFADAVARRAVQDKIAIGSQGLSTEDLSADQAGSPCAVDWCKMFREAGGKVALELQSVKQSNPDRQGRVGSMVDLLPFALKLHTQIFEIYAQDWLLAYDPEDPNYAQYHEEYQRAYEAAAKVVGAH